MPSPNQMSSPARRFRLWHIAVGIVVATLFGFTIFGVLAWRSITVERAGPEDAVRRFEQVRRQFASTSAARMVKSRNLPAALDSVADPRASGA